MLVCRLDVILFCSSKELVSGLQKNCMDEMVSGRVCPENLKVVHK